MTQDTSPEAVERLARHLNDDVLTDDDIPPMRHIANARDTLRALSGKLDEYKLVASAIDTMWLADQGEIKELKTKLKAVDVNLAEVEAERDTLRNTLSEANQESGRWQGKAEGAEAKLAKARDVADYLIRAFDHINEAPRRGPVDDVYLLVKTGSAIASVSDARAALALIDADTPAPEVSVEAAKEYAIDTIEEIIGETHDIYVTDRDYAKNVVWWLERHHPDALALIDADLAALHALAEGDE